MLSATYILLANIVPYQPADLLVKLKSSQILFVRSDRDLNQDLSQTRLKLYSSLIRLQPAVVYVCFLKCLIHKWIQIDLLSTMIYSLL